MSSIEAKNWEMVNKLREIDAWLIKHYSAKTKKTKPKKEVPIEYETKAESFKENYSVKAVSEKIKNDKNIVIEDESEVVLVEKKKTYELGMNGDDSSIFLSD